MFIVYTNIKENQKTKIFPTNKDILTLPFNYPIISANHRNQNV